MAEVHEDIVDKLVIESSGIVYIEDRKLEHIKKIERNVLDLLVLKTLSDVVPIDNSKGRSRQVDYKFLSLGVNRFPLQFECCKKEKEELILELLNEKPDVVHYHVLTQYSFANWLTMTPVDF
ncbi:hypothetical protein L1887_17896 [Cichorium endivia]|nr:hypothetical protein L1887_17896 [Cichorium endivia]